MVNVRLEVPAETRRLIGLMAPEAILGAVKASLQRYGALALRTVVTNSPRRTGAYGRGWDVRLTADNAITVGNRLKYAPFVEWDTRAHDIFPRNGKVLAWRKGGKGPISAFKSGNASASSNFNFAAHVHHPGTKGQHTLENAINETVPELPTMLGEEVRRALGG